MDLYLANGRKLGRVESHALQAMEANGQPPEVVVWGERMFALNAHGRYVEGLAWVITDTEDNRLVLS
ncbi:MAG TPA: hypothetical protein VE326_11385 [Candidatus Binatia bacterium]|nr:hypothetical protein [Candidatus Binatia bacterium]